MLDVWLNETGFVSSNPLPTDGISKLLDDLSVSSYLFVHQCSRTAVPYTGHNSDFWMSCKLIYILTAVIYVCYHVLIT